jgi:hypothetical protein
MDFFAWSELLSALSKLPVSVQLLMAVLVFILCVIVLVSNKARDNLRSCDRCYQRRTHSKEVALLYHPP